METVKQLFRRVTKVGIPKAYLERVLPSWVSDYPPASETGLIELKVHLAKELGLDLNSLEEGREVAFGALPSSPKFKRMRTKDSSDLKPAASMYYSLARALLAATQVPYVSLPKDPAVVRAAILDEAPTVNLASMLNYVWAVGIPVAHYSDWPSSLSRPSGMAVDVDGRPAILLGGARMENAWHAFYVAHEMGHIALGHVGKNELIIDAEEEGIGSSPDEQEKAADQYALSLLVGDQAVAIPRGEFSQQSLEGKLTDIANQSRIDRGHLALRYAVETGRWAQAVAALKYFEPDSNAPLFVNGDYAELRIGWDQLSEERGAFLRRALAI